MARSNTLDFRPATVDVVARPGSDLTWRVTVNDEGITVGTITCVVGDQTPTVDTTDSATGMLVCDITLTDTQTTAIGATSVSWSLSNTVGGVTTCYVAGDYTGSTAGNTSNGLRAGVIATSGRADVDVLVSTSAATALAAHLADSDPHAESALALESQQVDAVASLAIATVYARTDNTHSVLAKNPAETVLYGVSNSNGHWYTSTNGTSWTDRTYSPVSSAPTGIGGSATSMVVTDTYMFAVRASDSAVFRAPLDTFNAWTAVTPSGIPTGTVGRADILHHDGTSLFFGNYGTDSNYDYPGPGSFVWRSTDDGANWTVVLTKADARHVHAISHDPTTGHVWVTLGDSGGWTQQGLYRSTDGGASFSKVQADKVTAPYGINVVFTDTDGWAPGKVIIEGDGLNVPFLFAWHKDIDTAPTDPTPLVWPDTADADGNWRGTVRSITKTSEGNVLFISTSESGTVGTRDGIWLAKAPWFTRVVLLEEITGSTFNYSRGVQFGQYVFSGRYRMTVPKFQGQ